MDLQQWPKSLPSKGTLELDVLQLPLSKVPWIARDGSICIGGKQMAPKADGGKQMAPTADGGKPKAAGLVTASAMPAAEPSKVVEDHDNGDEPESGVNASQAAKMGEQAEADAGSDEGLSEYCDDRMDDTMMGAASSAVQSVPV